jgi:hypothetical protein
MASPCSPLERIVSLRGAAEVVLNLEGAVLTLVGKRRGLSHAKDSPQEANYTSTPRSSLTQQKITRERFWRPSRNREIDRW